ncbi:MAG: DegT/DnrJ/EryC1/StrS family aminotransferase [Candidatus Sungiibacteriota bacterium]
MAVLKLKRYPKKIGVGGAIITPYAKMLVNRVLDSGRISYGPMLRQFEEKFARLCERKFAISANSGTSALQVALHALKEKDDWRDGDEVIVPAITFVATSNVVMQNGLKPVFVDVDPRTYHLDPAKIEAAITPHTRAIMPVHLFGMSCDMDPIMAIARKHKLRVVEDSCEAVGVRYKGRPVGVLGDIACFSTYMAHLITTGVGGLALTNDADLAVRMKSLVNHGRDSIYVSMDDDKGLKGKARFEVVSKRFSFTSIGYSYRMTELEGALGIAELKTLKKNIKLRQRYATYLLRGMKQYERFLQLPWRPSDREHAYMMFTMIIKDPRIMRDELVAFLEDWNVETRYMMPVINQPVYVNMFGDLESKYPVAANINHHGFYIGCHPEMDKKHLDYILAVFAAFFKKKGLIYDKHIKAP